MISFVILYSLMLTPCYGLNRKLFNVSQIQSDNNEWQMAIATWYGPPDGAGSDGEYYYIIFMLFYVYDLVK
jgi:hypothetical protein